MDKNVALLKSLGFEEDGMRLGYKLRIGHQLVLSDYEVYRAEPKQFIYIIGRHLEKMRYDIFDFLSQLQTKLSEAEAALNSPTEVDVINEIIALGEKAKKVKS